MQKLFSNLLFFALLLLYLRIEALHAKNVPRFTLLHAYKTTKNAFNSYNYI